MITQLKELENRLNNEQPKKLAVASAEDENTIQAIAKAAEGRFITPFMVGNKDEITKTINKFSFPLDLFEIIDAGSETEAAVKSVELVKSGQADVLMKGLLSTSTYLKAVLDKEKGLLPKGDILSHITVIQVPSYHKLLFLSDVAVIPYPTYEQKEKMIEYAIRVTKRFGIAKPKISLLSATEKPTDKLPASVDAQRLTDALKTRYSEAAVIDGPLDIFLSLDPKSVAIKGIPTPVEGDADVLIFPNIEAGNIFYKSSVLFTDGKIAAMLAGTTNPVILTSRSDATESKYYSILLGCLMA